MSKKSNGNGVITRSEKTSYGMYFMGQNIFYVLISTYMTTYFTDVGIAAATVGVIALIVKIWDAINDPIFGGIVDKIKFRKGKFIPWLRISLIGISLATILMFSIPGNASPVVKIIWATVGYILWDTAYTICDVPIFGLVTTITSVQRERIVLNSIGRACAMIAGLIVMIVIPVFRRTLGGWSSTVIILSVIGAITMPPICITAKERVAPPPNEKEVGLKEMFSYLKNNKYLLIFYMAGLVGGSLNVGASWSMYIARYCLGNEAMAAALTLISAAPCGIMVLVIPALTKKFDKFKLFYFGTALTLVCQIIRLFIGYRSLTVCIAGYILGAIPMGLTGALSYMFTPDCAEYGHFKTGISAPGITFSAQTFFVKLQAAIGTAVGAAVLAAIGFVEGEGAVHRQTMELQYCICCYRLFCCPDNLKEIHSQ